MGRAPLTRAQVNEAVKDAEVARRLAAHRRHRRVAAWMCESCGWSGPGARQIATCRKCGSSAMSPIYADAADRRHGGEGGGTIIDKRDRIPEGTRSRPQ